MERTTANAVIVDEITALAEFANHFRHGRTEAAHVAANRAHLLTGILVDATKPPTTATEGEKAE